MAMEKKSLAGKKTAPATKGNSKKVDTSKPAASLQGRCCQDLGNPGGPSH